MALTRTNVQAYLARMITIMVLISSTKSNQFQQGLPTFTNKRPFECFERVKVIEGGMAELRCDAGGNPKPNITWTRFGEVVCNKHNMKVTEWSIELKDITRAECGLYECRVCNEHGCVTFEYLVEIDDNEKDIVTIGSEHQLKCYGIRSKTVEWTKNTRSRSCFASIVDNDNLKIPDPDQNGNLIFKRVNYADAGLYICTSESEYYLRKLIVVDNKFEKEIHHDHYFIMKHSGSMVTLECAWNDANITWTKNSDHLMNNTNSAIEIGSLTRDDGGLYRCEVCYHAECIAHQFLLVIDTILTENSMLYSTKIANAAELPYCDSVLSDFNVDYTIDYIPVQIKDANDEQLAKFSSVSKNEEMALRCMSGWCTCIVTSVYGKHFKSAFLLVALKNAAHFETNVQANRVLESWEGDALNISCDARGDPWPNITWTKDDTLLRQNDTLNSFAMYIKNLTKEDSGEYSCKICNMYGCRKRTYGILVRSRFNRNTRNETANVKSTVKLTCLDQYYSFVQKIVWTKNDEIVSPSPNTLQYVKNLSVLKLRDIKPSNAGIYICKLFFASGENKKIKFHVAVEGMHDEVVLTIATSVGIALCSCVALLAISLITRKLINGEQANEPNEASYETMDIIALSTLKIEQQRHSISSRICISSDPDYEIPTDIRWEFPRDKLELGVILAQGTFGKVVQAEAREIVPGINGTTTVAVKMLKLRHSDDDVEDFIRELDIMKMIGKHPNIINLLGCCSTNGPLYIITEYAPHGNLKHFLQEHRHGEINASTGTVNASCSLSVNQLTNFAYQIAKGMDYLASRKYVHRDLAARNILVNDDYVMKIADFGLARDVHAEEHYHKVTAGKLPIRWMAPESLEYRLFTTQSDVWSYGVLIWEIMTLGEQPCMDWDNIHDQLEKGRRMEQPELCPDEVYQLMTRCWQFQPEMRPAFSEIVRDLEEMVDVMCDDGYTEI